MGWAGGRLAPVAFPANSDVRSVRTAPYALSDMKCGIHRSPNHGVLGVVRVGDLPCSAA